MTPAERAALRLRWLAEISAEIERRQAAKLEAAGGDELERFMAQLDEMARRLRAAPDWREPTPEEQAQYGRDLDKWFHDNGYGR